VRWFPDGQSLLVSAYRDKGEGAVDYYRIDLRTGEPALQRRGTIRTSRKPCLSSDGRTVFFTERNADKADPTRLIPQG
jgi:Tol biopolymer transport system component